MSAVRWVLLFLAVIVYRTWFPETPPFPEIRFDFDLAVIILLGLYRGERVGAAAGWGIGFIAYATDADHFMWSSLLGALVGWVVGRWRDRLFLEQLLSRWIVFAIVALSYRLLHWPLIMGIGGGPWMDTLLYKVLPTTLIDATVTVLLSYIWERIERASDSETRTAGATVSKP
ncbi:MAG: hypothetical protein GF341_02300 [candidate division Zixibacteria bacterium]|nr:hypothetical protein [candidate division Zixibacteria bacterium]